jgi:transcriptional regulator with XRE-family HTH domain
VTPASCPSCGVAGRGWLRGAGVSWDCGACGSRSSATAGTIFHRTRTPLTVWFRAGWELTTRANGVSARGIQRTLGLGSYQTAWTMLHRYRRAMIMPGRAKLSGIVEVDDMFVGGRNKPGMAGRSARPHKTPVLVMVIVEVRSRGIGRCRALIVLCLDGASLRSALRANIEPGGLARRHPLNNTAVVRQDLSNSPGISSLGEKESHPCPAAVPVFPLAAVGQEHTRGHVGLSAEPIRGSLLMQLRQEAGLTRAAVARHVGVWDSASVAAWERGKQQPAPVNVPLLAAALGVAPLDLFEVVGAPSLGMLRRAAGLTLTELAEQAGVPYTRCQRIETGLMVPTGDDVARLSTALGVRHKVLRAAVGGVCHTAAATKKPTTSGGPKATCALRSRVRT